MSQYDEYEPFADWNRRTTLDGLATLQVSGAEPNQVKTAEKFRQFVKPPAERWGLTDSVKTFDAETKRSRMAAYPPNSRASAHKTLGRRQSARRIQAKAACRKASRVA